MKKSIFLNLLSAAALCSSIANAATDAKNTILFYGNSMVERLLEQGELEAYLQLNHKQQKSTPLHIRSLAWTGDEVGYRLRPEGYVRHLNKVLEQWKSNTIVLGYGMNEAFAGQEGLDEFKSQYQDYLNQLSSIHPNANFVLLSPTAIEAEQYPATKQQSSASQKLNANMELYTAAIRDIAAANDHSFIDLYTPSKAAYDANEAALTSNGLHLNEQGNTLVARSIAKQLSASDLSKIATNQLTEVAQAAAQKHHYVAEIIRPKNSVVYFGVRQRPQEYLAEMPRYHKLVEQSDQIIQQLLNDPQLKFASLKTPSLPDLPVIEGKIARKGNGVIKPPAEAMAEFKVAKDYEVSLFASEEEFPELRNPVQIAFDAEGRLWVVTMPSFPHTVPGLPQEDKILILEDTDNDGKADKSTVYADGFDALDGITFDHRGPIISAQPNHILATDENNDGVADTFDELLRGIDMTDSHHGGMLAADPYGGIIFSDGVFHRSQLETPYGVHRGIDASTYRHNLNTGEVRTEWQSAIPNPWKPTFDRWGNNYQMYGDGIVVDTLMLTWTPLGVYHPFRHGSILGYGKGSAATIISSENFPDDYQQGIASASLLGNYTVSITKTNFNNGPITGSDKLDLVSSPNAAFRPASLAFGMDGALYISDFCSAIIGHAQHAMRDPNWDHDHGRIWRVTHKNKPTVKDFPAIKGTTLTKLCSLLEHSNDLVRYHSRIELRKHGKEGLRAIDTWLANLDKDATSYEQSLLEAIFTAEGLGEIKPELIEILLKSKSPLFRSAAIHTVRLQADRLSSPIEMLRTVIEDTHPRVQMEVVDAIAHMQKVQPDIIDLAKLVDKKHQTVAQMLDDLKHGTESHKMRSIPVLSVSKKSQIPFWMHVGETTKSFEYGSKRPFIHGSFRTYIESDKEQPAILAAVFNYINVSVNGVRLLSDNERWSKDQQVALTLNQGINIIEVEFPKGISKRVEKSGIYIHDLMGNALSNATVCDTLKNLQSLDKKYQAAQEQFAGAVRIQAVPHQLKFSPTEFTVKAGSEVRVIFENPDSMLHNLLILKPETKNVVGALADQMAAQADGIEKAYIPDSSDVLHATKLVNPSSVEELKFKAPTKPGRYPYLCTFPGHWRVMQGVMIVE